MKIIGLGATTKEEAIAEINRGGKFVVFQYCVSVVFFSFKHPTDIYFIKSGESGFTKGLPHALLTFFAGWWGIPWGPIYTIQCLWTDLSGGKDVTQEVLATLTDPASAEQAAQMLAPFAPTWKKLALALGIVVALIVLLVGGVFLLGKFINRNVDELGTAQAIIPRYEDLVGEGLNGSAFHFRFGNKRYIACSLNQFENKTPSEVISLSFDTPIKITGTAHKQKDVQVLTYESVDLDKRRPLDYRGGASTQPNEPVALIVNGERIDGHILDKTPAEPHLVYFKTTKPFKAGGCSGAPVLSVRTGAVVGVALTADDAEKARVIGFELLRLPPELKGQ